THVKQEMTRERAETRLGPMSEAGCVSSRRGTPRTTGADPQRNSHRQVTRRIHCSPRHELVYLGGEKGIFPGRKAPLLDTRPPLTHTATLADLPARALVLGPEASGEDLVVAFERHPDVPGVLVGERGQLIGMISRRQFHQAMSRPFTRELFA